MPKLHIISHILAPNGVLLALLILCCKTHGTYSWLSVWHSRISGPAMLCMLSIFLTASHFFSEQVQAMQVNLQCVFRVHFAIIFCIDFSLKGIFYIDLSLKGFLSPFSSTDPLSISFPKLFTLPCQPYHGQPIPAQCAGQDLHKAHSKWLIHDLCQSHMTPAEGSNFRCITAGLITPALTAYPSATTLPQSPYSILPLLHTAFFQTRK